MRNEQLVPIKEQCGRGQEGSLKWIQNGLACLRNKIHLHDKTQMEWFNLERVPSFPGEDDEAVANAFFLTAEMVCKPIAFRDDDYLERMLSRDKTCGCHKMGLLGFLFHCVMLVFVRFWSLHAVNAWCYLDLRCVASAQIFNRFPHDVLECPGYCRS